MSQIQYLLKNNPIIGSIKSYNDLDKIVKSNVKVVFILFGSLLEIEDICKKLKYSNKIYFIHIDMIEGLKSDLKGIEYLKKEADPFGIITTKQSNIKHAHKFGLQAILRIFILDSMSLKSGKRSVDECLPDAVEILPGVSEKIVSNVKLCINLPIIAGGLVDKKDEVESILNSGAISISTTAKNLWDL